MKILEKFVREVPYNSVAPIFEHNGLSYPSWLGGNCVQQNKMFSKRLISSGFDVGFLKAKISKTAFHYATIGENENGVYLFDPFLMHINPIRLEGLGDTARDAQVYSAFPLSKVGQSHVDVWNKGDGKFSTRLFLVSENGSNKIRTYNYDLNDKMDSLPPLDSPEFYFGHAPLVRFLMEDNSKCSVFFDKNNGEFSSYTLYGNGKWEFIESYVDTGGFNQVVEKIARQRNEDPRDLVNHLELGRELYFSMR